MFSTFCCCFLWLKNLSDYINISWDWIFWWETSASFENVLLYKITRCFMVFHHRIGFAFINKRIEIFSFHANKVLTNAFGVFSVITIFHKRTNVMRDLWCKHLFRHYFYCNLSQLTDESGSHNHHRSWHGVERKWTTRACKMRRKLS